MREPYPLDSLAETWLLIALAQHCRPERLERFHPKRGFWFTDTGKITARQRDRGAVFYARGDGSQIKQVIFPLEGPNGIGLSADDRTLYVSESWDEARVVL